MAQTQVHEEAHATIGTYIWIAVLLTIITVAEVATYYIPYFNLPENHTILVVSLILMSAAKFFIVVGWYMHLKYDARIFRRFFLTGLIGATVILCALVLLFAYHPLNT
jgi:cytochrome c oxidase subunit 4